MLYELRKLRAERDKYKVNKDRRRLINSSHNYLSTFTIRKQTIYLQQLTMNCVQTGGKREKRFDLAKSVQRAPRIR